MKVFWLLLAGAFAAGGACLIVSLIASLIRERGFDGIRAVVAGFFFTLAAALLKIRRKPEQYLTPEGRVRFRTF